MQSIALKKAAAGLRAVCNKPVAGAGWQVRGKGTFCWKSNRSHFWNRRCASCCYRQRWLAQSGTEIRARACLFTWKVNIIWRKGASWTTSMVEKVAHTVNYILPMLVRSYATFSMKGSSSCAFCSIFKSLTSAWILTCLDYSTAEMSSSTKPRGLENPDRICTACLLTVWIIHDFWT